MGLQHFFQKAFLTSFVLFTGLAGCVPSQADLPGGTSMPAPTTTRMPTKTVTPSPTPYDPKNFHTFTPAPPAECPTPLTTGLPSLDFLDLRPASYSYDEYTAFEVQRQKNVLDFLNIYGPQPLMENARKRQADSGFWYKDYFLEDVTNDGIPEFMLPGALYQCYRGEYRQRFSFTPDAWGGLARFERIIEDANKNGIPELVLHVWSSNHLDIAYRLYEWGGANYNTILAEDLIIHYDGTLEFKDVNNDGVDEFIVTMGVFDYYSPTPYIQMRNESTYYRWDGGTYVYYDTQYDDPLYRFQAVQDADNFVRIGQHDRALELYKEVISNGELEWWSTERRQLKFGMTPPEQDWDEYYWLASYARFRMLVLYTLIDNLPAAQSVYVETLNYSVPNAPGYHYYRLGVVFWTEYQKSHDVNRACRQAVAYAEEHPELLTPLGNEEQGFQSKIYTPEDVCPGE